MLKCSGIICQKFGLLVVLIGWGNVGRERESEWMSGSYCLEQFIWNCTFHIYIYVYVCMNL